MAGKKVHLRERITTKGEISLYLDFYPPIKLPGKQTLTRRLTLGINLYSNPKTEYQKTFNSEMRIKAEAIRGEYLKHIINEEYGFIDASKKKADFLQYFYDYSKEKGDKWLYAYFYFDKFMRGNCTFAEITIELCHAFKDYLLKSQQLRNKHLPLARNSAAAYFRLFKAILKKAHKDKWLRENITLYIDGITEEESIKEFLTLEEVNILANTPCKYEVLKRASLFSCFTGLRISDILKLTWSEVIEAPDGGFCVRTRTQKTKTPTMIPLNDDALSFCGYRGEGLVFKGLSRSMVNHPLKQWIKSAGINRNISFHCLRHSFATIQITLGTDIYTVSKMLTHSDIKTTQVYAKIVDEKTREASNKMKLNNKQDNQ